jgi:peroxiredoxin
MRKLCTLLISLFLLNGLLAVRPGELVNEWQLADLNGKTHRLSDYKDQVIVMEWFNYDCPFVLKHYDTGSIQKLQKQSRDKGVIWLSVSSGKTESKELKNSAKDFKVHSNAVLKDPKGTVAKHLGARTTPHVFIIDRNGKVAYSGALDDQPTPDPASLKNARNYVSEALDAILAGKPVKVPSTRPYGCGVK